MSLRACVPAPQVSPNAWPDRLTRPGVFTIAGILLYLALQLVVAIWALFRACRDLLRVAEHYDRTVKLNGLIKRNGHHLNVSDALA